MTVPKYTRWPKEEEHSSAIYSTHLVYHCENLLIKFTSWVNLTNLCFCTIRFTLFFCSKAGDMFQYALVELVANLLAKLNGIFCVNFLVKSTPCRVTSNVTTNDATIQFLTSSNRSKSNRNLT